METEVEVTHLDTHLVVWLFEGRLELIPAKVQTALERADLCISPIVALELEYLFETHRISVNARTITDDLAARIGLNTCQQPFAHVITQSLREAWTRDPFDRIMVAQARLQNVPLMTKDRVIRRHYAKARWSV